MKPYYQDNSVTIYHGDCREVLPSLEPVDLAVTDPPYGVGYDLGNDTDAVTNRPAVAMALDRVKATSMLTFGTLDRYELLSWRWRWAFVWHKPMARATPAWGVARHYELVHWYTQGDAYSKPTTTVSDVFDANPPLFRTNPENVAHPAQKPLSALRRLIGYFDAPLILDPFMGSGTTLVAARDLGRKAIGIEIEERYCEMAVGRLRQEVLPMEDSA